MKWEYLCVYTDANRITFVSDRSYETHVKNQWDTDGFRVLGEDRWEMCGIRSLDNHTSSYWFKRQVKDD